MFTLYRQRLPERPRNVPDRPSVHIHTGVFRSNLCVGEGILHSDVKSDTACTRIDVFTLENEAK